MLALFSGEPSSVEVADDVPGGGSAGTRAGQSVVQLIGPTTRCSWNVTIRKLMPLDASVRDGQWTAVAVARPIKPFAETEIGFFGFGQDNPWSQYMFDAIEDEAARYGAAATFVGPPTFDAAVEAQAITDASVSKAFDAIVVVPIDGPSLAPAVSDAVAAGIKVVTVGFPVGPDALSQELQVKGVVSQVLESLPGNAEVMAEGVIEACADVDPCEVGVLWGARALAFDKVKPSYFEEAIGGHPNIKIVCETDAAYTQDLGRTQAGDCLSAHPDLDVIASQADESTRGAEGAIEAAGKSFGEDGDIKLVSAYASTYGVEQVRRGAWLQTSYNRPQSMGRAAVRLALLALAGQEVPTFVSQEELDGVPTRLTKAVLKEHPEVVGQWTG